MAKIKPLWHNVLVRPDESPRKTSTGKLFIPHTADEEASKSTSGTVVAVGPGTEDEPIEVTPGDKIVYRRYTGHLVEWEGEELILMDADEVLARRS